MKRPAGCFGGMVLLLIVATVGAPCESGEAMPADTPALNLALPFQGPGQLVMIVSRGWPPSDQLVVVTPDGARGLGAEAPWRNPRWRSPREIIVRQSGPGWSGNIFRLDSNGKILETITAGNFLRPEPSPDARRLAVGHVLHDGGLTALEVRDLTSGFRLVCVFSPDILPRPWLAAWNSEGTQLAVSFQSLEGTRFQNRLAIASLEGGSVKRLYASAEDREKDPRGIVLMFWHPSGIYAWSARGVLRCDPEGAGCTEVYDPGDGRHVIGGTALGPNKALLLVKDVQADFLEPRAKEIHILDLNTGKGKLWVRLPDDVFVSDIDWIGDADSNESDSSGSS